jgi:chitin synthase
MNGPTTPGGSHYYGRPPAYEDEDNLSPQLQGGSTMRLLTNAADESQSYMP